MEDLVALSGKTNNQTGQYITVFHRQIRSARFIHLFLFLTCDDSDLNFYPLVGGHTLGFSHCSSFAGRIRNFNATHDIDPSMHPSLAANLRGVCPSKNRPKNSGTAMDPSSTTFDNTYYKLILQGKGLFSSDQALLAVPKTKGLVEKFAGSHQEFADAFVKSMIKMSSITGGQEVRRDCRVVN